MVFTGPGLALMEAFAISTGLVALAEVGDKTQLLAIVLAARFRKPVLILIGILLATLANHALAGLAGTWVASAASSAWVSSIVGPDALRWAVGLSFLAMALWTLVPDKYEELPPNPGRFGVLLTTLVAFFLTEIGDKTQIATVALAARYDALAPVIAGTTLGMMAANVPAVLLGDVAATKLNMRLMHRIAAGLFAILGISVLFASG